jgi:hypothetical protein
MADSLDDFFVLAAVAGSAVFFMRTHEGIPMRHLSILVVGGAALWLTERPTKASVSTTARKRRDNT